MIISNGAPAKPAQAATPQKPVQYQQPAEPRFATLVGRHPSSGPRLVSEDAPAYNRSGDQAHATSFEAMPIIAAVAIDMAAAPPDQRATGLGASPLGTNFPMPRVTEDGNGSPHRAIVPPLAVADGPSLPMPSSTATASHGVTSAADAPPVAVIGARPSRSPTPAAVSHNGPGSPHVTGRSAPPRAVADAIALALGSGVSVFFHAEGSEARVAVRGLRIEASDRGEIGGRIAKLMRAHGYAVSEDMIYFEGAEK